MENQKTIVLVTGANNGLGTELIRSLCRSPTAYEVLVGAKSLVRAQQTSQTVVNEFPTTRSRTWPLQVDVEDDSSINGAYNEVLSKFGRLDVLLNNAGKSDQIPIDVLIR